VIDKKARQSYTPIHKNTLIDQALAEAMYGRYFLFVKKKPGKDFYCVFFQAAPHLCFGLTQA
jgi:hypothetical protein